MLSPTDELPPTQDPQQPKPFDPAKADAQAKAMLAQGGTQHDVDTYLHQTYGLKSTEPGMQGHDYHAEFASGALARRMARENTNDREADAATPSPFEDVASHALNIAQGIPGAERIEAGAGALGSAFTKQPMTYAQSLATLRDKTGEIPVAARVGERMLGGLTMTGAPGLQGLSAAKQGAAVGGLSALTSADEEPALDRAAQTAVGTGLGAFFGRTLSRGRTAVKAAAADDPAALLTSLAAKRTATSVPLYKDFRSLGDLGRTPELDALIGTPTTDGLPVVRRAIETVKGESPVLSKLPDTDARVLDAVYKRVGSKSFQAAHGFESGEARTALLDAIDKAAQAKGGSYAAPVDAYREGSQAIGAVTRGRDVISNATSASGGAEKAAISKSPPGFLDWLAQKSRTDAERDNALRGLLGQIGRRGIGDAKRVAGVPLIPRFSNAVKEGAPMLDQIDPSQLPLASLFGTSAAIKP